MKRDYRHIIIDTTQQDAVTIQRKTFLADILIDGLLTAVSVRKPYRAWDSRSRAIEFIHSPQAHKWGELLGLNWHEVLRRIEAQKYNIETV